MILISMLVLCGVPFWVDSVDSSVSKMKGRILLQVEKNGEAWYVIPETGERVFLSRPADALQVMKKYSLGVNHRDLLEFKLSGFPEKLAGKILLDVEDKGKAYYISPDTLKEHYLGRPGDAFQLMREKGLGISDKYLVKIPEVADNQDTDIDNGSLANGDKDLSAVSGNKSYSWEYKGKEFNIKLNLFDSVYDHYRNKPKVITYLADEEFTDKTEKYFNHYLNTEFADDTFVDLASSIKKEAEEAGLNENETLELASTFVQSIPYDHELAENILNNPGDHYMKYPYEVLYEGSGTCGGKSFLTVLLFDRLGYGTALFEFKEDNHLAPAVKCSPEHSTYSSGYCYVEATIKGYPIGIMPEDNPTEPSNPKTIESQENITNITQDISDLSEGEIHRKTEGNTYTGIKDNIESFQYITELKKDIKEEKTSLEKKREELNSLKEETKTLRDELDRYKKNEEYDKYNNLLPSYNDKVQKIEKEVEEYNALVNNYNKKTNEYNSLSAELYQY